MLKRLSLSPFRSSSMLVSARWGVGRFWSLRSGPQVVIIIHEQHRWTSCYQSHECKFHALRVQVLECGRVVVPPTSSQIKRLILCGSGEVLWSFALLDCNPRAARYDPPRNILSVVLVIFSRPISLHKLHIHHALIPSVDLVISLDTTNCCFLHVTLHSTCTAFLSSPFTFAIHCSSLLPIFTSDDFIDDLSLSHYVDDKLWCDQRHPNPYDTLDHGHRTRRA
ncbi:hypothetical protein EDD16DRAFT_1630732 [Pisolithus croceorrhizus]|nr:hypothetical protein EDD16DRAFT_1630732 [Pisolithus croceorrhizus]